MNQIFYYIIDTGKMIHGALVGCAEALINCEVQLNELDRESGDGDCGTTLKRGAQGMIKHHALSL